ncbi:MAG: DUF5916 domain-containing protein [Sphingobacteriaceae bacterium]
MMKPLFTLLLLCFCVALFGQTPKKMSATRVDKAPKIDGLLGDGVWKNAPVYSGFVELQPNPGKPEAENQRTEIRILYDDVAIYVAARMYEANIDSIAHELVARDQVGNADFIGISFDTYFDKINANGFYLTAAGSQFDAKYSQSGNEDPSWNAVWEGAVKLDNQGWVAEFKIPYSALRFSSKNIQNWGVNVIRKRQKANQQLFWNPISPTVNGFINQEGELDNLENIKAPLRLSFSPYVSTYVNHYPFQQAGMPNTTGAFNGGMDVKYGINQSFTLDMTLVPDFGQVKSDNQVLNLTPFEVKFDENRSFFTEGTELFSKGDLFYSRRVGARPINFYGVQNQLQVNERIVENPAESRLLNATKISGRTAQGLGIGFFNAVTKKMEAIVENNLGQRRFIETQPLSNYNILVLDQTLKNNSSVSFINTNVTREGSADDANVSAFMVTLNDKKNNYFVSTMGRMSKLSAGFNHAASTGYTYDVLFGKQSGNFTWSVYQSAKDDAFDPNDMGILFNNNNVESGINLSYNVYKPGKWYNKSQSWFNYTYVQRFKPSSYQSSSINMGSWMQFKNFWSANVHIDYQLDGNDFYEPRTAGEVFKTGANHGFSFHINSNRSKKYGGGAYIAYRSHELFSGKGYGYGFYQNYRVNDKIALGVDLSVEPQFNNVGFVERDQNTNETIFSTYNRHTVESSMDAKYTFNNRMGLKFVVRHYWSDRRNKEFYTLLANGSLQANASFVPNNLDINYNTFNVDMEYTWNFAPGSEFSATWKNAAELYENRVKPGYAINLNNTLKSPQNNTVSLKLLYYIDYLNLRKRSH